MEKCGSKQVKYTILALKNQLNALSLTGAHHRSG